MKIAIYCPLKSSYHPVPSGDRLMARLLMKAMRISGHEVEVVSELRSFVREPEGAVADDLQRSAEEEIDRISALWSANGKPDIWFCYHPYYKARDLLGPHLCRGFGLPYVTAEASYSPKRNETGWSQVQAKLLDDLRFASTNICFTKRDREGLSKVDEVIRTAMLQPFIDASLLSAARPKPVGNRLATVAMMRPGDKLGSYRALAEALALLPDELEWTLDIVGDGSERETVKSLFGAIQSERLIWHGEKTAEEIAKILSHASLYLWPGHGEAYGLAYLEAQAAGLPVIAEKTAGVPEVVMDGETGVLTPSGDPQTYATAIRELLQNDARRQAMAEKARHFATVERSLDKAAVRLDDILKSAQERKP